MNSCSLAERVAALMRAGGWRRVAVTASMGRLGTDVVGLDAGGRRWLIRCHRAPDRLAPSDVHRFADAARLARRADVKMLVIDGPGPEPLLTAAVESGVTLVDSESLAWWAAVTSPAGASSATSLVTRIRAVVPGASATSSNAGRRTLPRSGRRDE